MDEYDGGFPTRAIKGDGYGNIKTNDLWKAWKARASLPAEQDAELYKRQRDELGAHVVPVYEALDALFDNAQELEVDDVLGRWVSNDLWHELEDVLDPAKAIANRKDGE
jgi:hypothetical protein